MEKDNIGHTPGPWCVDGGHGNTERDLFIWQAGLYGGGHGLAQVFADGAFIHGGSVDANAQLIAAAPELLEQCHRLLNILDCPGSLRKTYKHCIDTSKAIIAKAEGK
jgi:hypothetical protein